MSKNFYVTTPIYYVNDKPHIGHAYTSLAADILARFKRLDNFNVFFLTGTDEHGQKVEKSAINQNKSPQEFCDEISVKFKNLANFMGYSHDHFIRTTDKNHKKTAQKFWQILEEKGYIYKDIYEGWYAIRDEAFYNEDEIIDGKAPTGAEVVWEKQESYFFKLSEFEKPLLDYIAKNPDFIAPQSKKNEVISFLKSGLKDLSISRTSFNWGVKVPNNENHVIYVWLDALTNYLSALNFCDNDQKYQDFWQKTSQNSPIHIVGKDILRFHAIYWPAFLMAAEIPLPKKIYAHGWWTNEGQKISKSIGNIIDPFEEVEWLKSKEIKEKTAIDYLRYFLIKEIPFGSDGNYAKEQFINRINSELANNIGNLTQRCLTMIHKNCDSKIKKEPNCNENIQILENIREKIGKLEFDKALDEIINFANQINKEFNDYAPWNLKKDGKIDKMEQVLSNTAENIRKIAILLLPFIENSSRMILGFLNINKEQQNFNNFGKKLEKGVEINEIEVAFPRIK
jgi:methionyl-tRNA synthetase